LARVKSFGGVCRDIRTAGGLSQKEEFKLWETLYLMQVLAFALALLGVVLATWPARRA
jgi:hypothetical protein